MATTSVEPVDNFDQMVHSSSRFPRLRTFAASGRARLSCET